MSADDLRAENERYTESCLLPEGEVVLFLPLPLSKQSLEDLEEWFQLAVKRFRRIAPADPKEV